MQLPKPPEAESKNFIRLKKDESVEGVFQGEPYFFGKHWMGTYSIHCISPCSECEKGKKPSFRFWFNFIVKEGDQYIAKIFDHGRTTYESIMGLNESYPLEDHVVRITRKEGEQKTEYSILPKPKGEIAPALKKIISEVKLHELSALRIQIPKAKEEMNPGSF